MCSLFREGWSPGGGPALLPAPFWFLCPCICPHSLTQPVATFVGLVTYTVFMQGEDTAQKEKLYSPWYTAGQGKLPLRSLLDGALSTFSTYWFHRFSATWSPDLFIALLTRAASAKNSLLIQAIWNSKGSIGCWHPVSCPRKAQMVREEKLEFKESQPFSQHALTPQSPIKIVFLKKLLSPEK